jgi:Tol biopolymer transport system component
MKINKLAYLFLFFCWLSLATACNKIPVENNTPEPSAERPQLKGKLVYHSYSSYSANDSKMYLYNFETNQQTCISEHWNIINAMNAHFSPDGAQITFMGVNPSTNTWSVYIHELGSADQPRNLSSNHRDEDPKFAPDGKRITFKRDRQIVEMNIATGDITVLSPAGYSMPYYSTDGSKLVCSKDGKPSSIEVIDISAKTIRSLYSHPDIQNYYPIGADEKSFYYTTGYSPSNRIDQIYRGYWSGVKSLRLPFNNTDGDYSDAYPVNSQWLIISSTRKGSVGGYDLYIANVETGDVYSLSEYNREINTSQEELGASYYE